MRFGQVWSESTGGWKRSTLVDQRALRSTDYVADEQRSVERDIIESLPHWRESGSREITCLVDRYRRSHRMTVG